MKKLLELITGKDNTTLDLGRVSWVASTVGVVGGVVVNSYNGLPVDLVQFATALGVVVAAHAGALFLKKDTEPTPDA